ncbi:MAG: hypothetical protein A3F54_01235 [Candidatus Kerfeldbacteria bacterium RIFCSPHIGHO2_12_FULL_48_17]|uniref:Rod shape-determining protein RodA n=1 Tax=Candidatus Kerfeldbacteria bacterium RIFCSPHIGHO2_12_FULL_48_17 TaxID=1798542 RepID=A0A1G2AXP3_9BACT|nr:MAG: hypothetical protein A3F54_01235 [Candidatus Kerfeldbacteria bacterium RIFCSPHIGHO2_12_FULL_48_17]
MKTKGWLTKVKKIDWGILIFTAILVTFGLSIIYSIGLHGEKTDLSVFYKQLAAVGIGVAILMGALFFDYRFLQPLSWIACILGLLLLASVLLFGITIRGTTGWLNLGFTTVQPVELAKVFLIVTLAAWLTKCGGSLERWQNLVISALIVFAYTGLVLLQPDLGSAMVFVGVWVMSLFVTRTPNLYRIGIIVLSIIFAVSSWFFLSGFQKDRIRVFLDPGADPLGIGYNVTQSIISVGSGRWFGRGLGLGPQSQLNFLPEQETDFIFAVIAEEMGLIGASVLLLSFGLLWFMIWRRARKTSDLFGMYVLTLGLFQFFIQTFVNIGMNMGISPVTGIPLPFISSGGSSMIASLLLVGLFEGIALRNSEKS